MIAYLLLDCVQWARECDSRPAVAGTRGAGAYTENCKEYFVERTRQVSYTWDIKQRGWKMRTAQRWPHPDDRDKEEDIL